MNSFIENGSRHNYVYVYGKKKHDEQERVVSSERLNEIRESVGKFLNGAGIFCGE